MTPSSDSSLDQAIRSFTDPGPLIHFENSFRPQEGAGTEPSPPSGFAFTPEGNLIVADDFNHRIQIYDADHRLIRCFGGKGGKPGELHYPKGTAVDADGNIYVADSWNHRVQKFDRQGNPLAVFGSCGEGRGQLNEPYDLLIDPSGRLIVVERYNHRIQFFSPDGDSLGWVGTRGTVLEEQLACIFETPSHLFAPPIFEFPTSIARDSLGNFFISDSGNHRIVKFDREWNQVLAFGERGTGPAQFEYPLCVAVGPNDLLYVADLNNDRIQGFTSYGGFLFDSRGVEGTALIQAPCLTAIDPRGVLHVGLTFDTHILQFQAPVESQESLLNRRIQNDPGNWELLFQMARLLEEKGDTPNAVRALQNAARTLAKKNTGGEVPSHDAVDLLMDFSRRAIRGEDAVTGDLPRQGLELLGRRLDADRQAVLDCHRKWEAAAREHNVRLIAEQQSILEDKGDPREFNRELFEAEKRDKTLFREIRVLFYFYRKTAQKFSEYLGNILNSGRDPASLAPCLQTMENRYASLCQIMIRIMDEREKNEEAMVQAFGEMPDHREKWETFLTRFNGNRRAMDVLKHLQFELRTLLGILKGAALQFPKEATIKKILQRGFLDPPGAETPPKLLLGFQEDWPLHTSLEIMLKDLTDTRIASWDTQDPVRTRDIGVEDFSPVEFDSEELNLEDITRAVRIEGMLLKKDESRLVCGGEGYPLKAIGNQSGEWAERLLKILHHQTVYEIKYQEISRQLETLTRQKQELDAKLNHVNPQDKKTPITLQNNIAVLEFQMNLLRRMILTLGINEANNLCRLILGFSLLISSKNSKPPSAVEPLVAAIKSHQSELEEKIEGDLRDRKTRVFEVSRLTGVLEATDLAPSAGDLDQFMETQKQLGQTQASLEQLESGLERAFKARALVNKLFECGPMTGETGGFPVGNSSGLKFKFSFWKNGPRHGEFLKPYGIAHSPEGELLVADYDHHQIYRFSAEGGYLSHFGGWGNSPGFFRFPTCLQLDREGFIYVGEEKNARIQKFTREGEFVLSFGDREEPEQRLGAIFSLSIDRENRVWAADPNHHRIQIYDSKGKLVRSIKRRGEAPEDLFEPVSVYCLEDGEYLVSDRSNYVLKHFSSEHRLINGLHKGSLACEEIYFLTRHPGYGIFATDYWYHQILHLNSKLEVVSIYRNPGKRAGQFGKIGGLSIHGNLLFAADFDNSRIQALELTVPNFS
ncbi:MAG: hypothetical protein ACE5E9_03685 [Nitrospinaceae bacterium]